MKGLHEKSTQTESTVGKTLQVRQIPALSQTYRTLVGQLPVATSETNCSTLEETEILQLWARGDKESALRQARLLESSGAGLVQLIHWQTIVADVATGIQISQIDYLLNYLDILCEYFKYIQLSQDHQTTNEHRIRIRSVDAKQAHVQFDDPVMTSP